MLPSNTSRLTRSTFIALAALGTGTYAPIAAGAQSPIPSRTHLHPSSTRKAGWYRFGLRHVAPADVLEALRGSGQWQAMLHNRYSEAEHHASRVSLAGISLVVPSRRDNALFVRGRWEGIQNFRQIVMLLDTPERVVGPTGAASSPVTSTLSPYDAILVGNWRRAAGAAHADPSQPENQALEGYALAKMGRAAQAEPLISHALQQTAGQGGRVRALALAAAGALAEAAGSRVEAIAYYQKAAGADDTLALIYIGIANSVASSGRTDHAKRFLQDGLQTVKTPQEKAALTRALGSM